jgi:hypothetical protein
MKNRRLFTAALAATMLVGSFGVAGAHHRNPNLSFSPSNSVNVGDVVTVAAYDAETNGEVSIDVCRVSGVDSAAAACDTAAGGTGSWVQVASGNKTSAVERVEYSAPTGTAGVFGYRAWSALDENHAGDIADLTVNAVSAAQRHNACNGIENAHGKVKDDGKAKQKLAEHAEKFGCDVE